MPYVILEENEAPDSTGELIEDHTMIAAKDTLLRDKSTLLFLMFYVLGTISFVPQNFYVTANDYWMYKFRNVSASLNSSDAGSKTDLQKNFTAYYSNVSSVCMLVFLILTVLISKRISLQVRIVGSLSVMMSMFLITLTFVWIDTDSWQHGFFIVALIIGAFLTGSGGCFLISVFELSSKFPLIYLGAQLSGQSICGVLASLTQIFTLSLNGSSTISAMIYFSICVFMMLATMVFYLLIFYNNQFFQIHLNKEAESEARMKIDFSQFKIVAKKLSMLMITMVLTSGSGVIMFPGVTSLVESVGKGTSRWSDVFFVPVCNYLSFHLFDFIGREMSLRWFRIKNIYVILAVGVLRLAFIPLLMLCNAQPRSHLPVVFKDDYPFIIFIIIFAFTSGYFLNLCIIQIPSMVEEEEKKLATIIVVLVMVISLGSCSFLASVMVHAL